MLPGVVSLLVAASIAATAACAGSSPAATPTFAVREPGRPLELKLSSPPLAAWGRVPRLRLIYYLTDGLTPNDLDRQTIFRELRLVKDFYSHYGLILTNEDSVYVVNGHAQKDIPDEHSYHAILNALDRRNLLIPYRTIVFATFDVGLGKEIALTGLSDANVAKLECPRPGKGFAWWCGRPESAHWAGSVHEAGHMLGLSHPDEYKPESPYVFLGSTRTYVYDKADGEKTVMMRHEFFLRRPQTGLLPHEVDLLFQRYHDAGATEPDFAAPRL